ncbi:metal ABC transporter substrate-binding protein [Mariniluteicoccus flavus]
MRQIPRALGALLTVPALLLAAGCGGTQGAATQPGQLTVVAAFYPLQYASERVAGSAAKVESLTQPGAEAHDLELTPKQIASLSSADVVVYQKGFQPAVDKAIEQAKPKKVVDVASVVTFTTTEAQDEGHGTAGHDHDHSKDASDPHTWLDPQNMVAITRAVNEALATAKPDQKDAFATNAAATTRELTELDTAFTSGLKTCKRKEFITSHAAFGYLAKRYGLEQIGIRGVSPDEEPSPTRIAQVHQLATEHNVTTIFYETLVSPAVAESVARDLKLKTDVLDPLEGITDKSRGKNYVEVMKSNLTALRAANECA